MASKVPPFSDILIFLKHAFQNRKSRKQKTIKNVNMNRTP